MWGEPVTATIQVQRDGVATSHVLETTLTIGRSADNAIVLEGEEVSRHHGVLALEGSRVLFTDLGSANGSRVGGVEANPREARQLGDGQELQIGKYSIRLQAGTSPPQGSSPTPRHTNSGTEVLEAWLEIDVGGQTSRRALSGDLFSVGRSASADIVLDSQYVSREHFALRRVGGTFQAEDKGTTNGLRVNGQPVTTRQLADGDVIEPADGVSLRFRLPVAAPAVQAEQTLLIAGNREVTVGRDPGCDVTLQHPAVSRRPGRHGPRTQQGGLVEEL
jgi:pSer/pThr/pTyr-binding forkhead associated (FHA) protein